MNIERRTLRSERRCEALGYFLAAESRRRAARAMAIGSVDGLPLAAWGDDDLRLAAVGALFASGKQAAARDYLEDVQATTISSTWGPLVLTCCGTGTVEAGEVGRHVSRILG